MLQLPFKEIYPFGEISTKIYEFCRFLALVTHILTATIVKFSVRVQTWDSLRHANFAKIAQGDWLLRGRFIPKIPYFDDFGGLKPTFLRQQW